MNFVKLSVASYILLGHYFGIYFFLSSSGRYEANYSVISKIVGPCLCVSDSEEWQPLWIIFAHSSASSGRHAFYANSLGYIFLPLVNIDQQYWHPAKMF